MGLGWGACGVWQNGVWHQKFSGEFEDAAYSAATIAWLANFTRGCHGMRTKKGKPLQTIPNFSLGEYDGQNLKAWNDSRVMRVVDIADAIQMPDLTVCA